MCKGAPASHPQELWLERDATTAQLWPCSKRITKPTLSLLLPLFLPGDSHWLNPSGQHQPRDTVPGGQGWVEGRTEPYREWMGWGRNQNNSTVFFLGSATSVFLLEMILALSCGVLPSVFTSFLSQCSLLTTPTPRAPQYLYTSDATGAPLTPSLPECQSCTLYGLLMSHFHIPPQPGTQLSETLSQHFPVLSASAAQLPTPDSSFSSSSTIHSKSCKFGLLGLTPAFPYHHTLGIPEIP